MTRDVLQLAKRIHNYCLESFLFTLASICKRTYTVQLVARVVVLYVG